MKGRTWYEADPTLYAQIVREVKAVYRNLYFSTQDDIVYLKGSFPISDGERVIDRYQIEVEFPLDFPDSLPIVRELGGRIPRNADRHIFKQDDALCLFVADEASWVCPDRSDFLGFLDGPVRNFLISQTVFDLTGKWPFGQRSHGAKGLFEFYAEKLAASDVQVVLKLMDLMRKKEIKGHWPCPCGSGKRLRDCHYRIVREFRQKTQPIHIDRSYRMIADWILAKGR